MSTSVPADLSAGVKKDLVERAEQLINDYGKISRLVLKESGLHENLMQTARVFSTSENAVNNTAESLKQMKFLTTELKASVDQITASMQDLTRLNSLLLETQRIARSAMREEPTPQPTQT